MFTALFPPLDLVLLLIAFPSFFFYVSFLYVAIKRRKDHPFNSSFFTISRFVGVGDCIMLIGVHMLHKPARWGLLPQVHLRFA